MNTTYYRYIMNSKVLTLCNMQLTESSPALRYHGTSAGPNTNTTKSGGHSNTVQTGSAPVKIAHLPIPIPNDSNGLGANRGPTPPLPPSVVAVPVPTAEHNATAAPSTADYSHYNSKLTINDFDLLKVRLN